jgi:hypothetical protein
MVREIVDTTANVVTDAGSFGSLGNGWGWGGI